MPRDEARTIKVRLSTWEQVESFFNDKLKGSSLIVKLPVACGVGDGVTVALGLPNGLTFAIDGAVALLGKQDKNGKFPVQLKMHGLTPQVRERVMRLCADGRAGLLSQPSELPLDEGVSPELATTGSFPGATDAHPLPAPTPADAPVDEELEAWPAPRLEDVVDEEQPEYRRLDETLKRLLQQHAHEVLAVAPDAGVREVRRGYFALTKQFHPDAFGKYRSPALRHLCAEVFIHINKAYDRMREAAAATSGTTIPAPAGRSGGGWLATADDFIVAPEESAPPVEIEADTPQPIRGELREGAERPQLTGAAPSAPAAAPAPAASKPLLTMRVPSSRATPEMPAEPPPQDAGTSGALSADDLFGDLGLGESSRPVTAPILPGAADAAKGRAALEEKRWTAAAQAFAAALRADPRNRLVRALYHVATGFELRERGKQAEAQLQFETALIHDKDCAEAQHALGRKVARR